LELRRIPALIRGLTVVQNIEVRAEGKEELIRDILPSSPRAAELLPPHSPRSP